MEATSCGVRPIDNQVGIKEKARKATSFVKPNPRMHFSNWECFPPTAYILWIGARDQPLIHICLMH